MMEFLTSFGQINLLKSTWLMFEEVEGNKITVDERMERKILKILKNEQTVFIVAQVQVLKKRLYFAKRFYNTSDGDGF